MARTMEDCIHECLECHRVCLKTLAQHCLAMGGRHVEQRHFRLMLDCAQICQVAADFMLRGSDHHTHLCAECAEICRLCADSCEDVGDMGECVEACRACGTSCAEMAATA